MSSLGILPASFPFRNEIKWGLNAVSVLPSTRIVSFKGELRGDHCSRAGQGNSLLTTFQDPVRLPISRWSFRRRSNPLSEFHWAEGSGLDDPNGWQQSTAFG